MCSRCPATSNSRFGYTLLQRKILDSRAVPWKQETGCSSWLTLFAAKALFQTDCNLAGIEVERARNYILLDPPGLQR